MESNAHIVFLFPDLSHQSHAVLESCLVCSSHLGGSSFTYDVKEFLLLDTKKAHGLHFTVSMRLYAVI